MKQSPRNTRFKPFFADQMYLFGSDKSKVFLASRFGFKRQESQKF